MSKYTIAQQADGHWALHDACGKPFFSLGVDCVTLPDNKYMITQREATRKQDWFPTWMQQKLAEMTEMGFNTLGAWHHPFFWGNDYPKTVEVRMSASAAKVNTVWGMGFPDVFDPSFEVSAKKALIETLFADGGRLLHDEGLIGCYTDNEIHWWGSGGYWGDNEQAEQGRDCTALVDDYIMLPPESAGKKRWVQFLRQRYGSIEGLNGDWGSEYCEFEDVHLQRRYMARPHALQAAKLGFLSLIAQMYFKTTDRLLKAYVPGTLNLGCRFVGNSTPDVVLRESGRYVDANSFNFYSMELPADYLTYAYGITKKPMMLTEFSFCAGRSAGFKESTNGARNVTVLNQLRRGESYRNFLAALTGLPFMLGAHWFAMFDFGYDGNGLVGNYGLYDLEARPYNEFIRFVTEANHQAIRGITAD